MGLSSKTPLASQKFNRWLDEARIERKLGWSAEMKRDRSGRVVVSVRGVPAGARLEADARHPLGRLPDRRLRLIPAAPGRFESREVLPPGRWRVRLTMATDGHIWRSEGDLRVTAPLAIDSRFTVPGMRCAGCIAQIERGLNCRGARRARAARVNFSAKRVAVGMSPQLDDDAVLTERSGDWASRPARAADNPLAQRRCRDEPPAPRAGGCRVRHDEHHAAVGQRLVGRDGVTRDTVPLAVGVDRHSGHRLFGTAVLRFGGDGAASRAHQHGRPDLDRRPAGDRAEHLRNRHRAASMPISTAR